MLEGKARCGQQGWVQTPAPPLPLIRSITLGRSLCFPLNVDRNLYFALWLMTVRSATPFSLWLLLPAFGVLPSSQRARGLAQSSLLLQALPVPTPPPAFAIWSPSSLGSDSPCTVPAWHSTWCTHLGTELLSLSAFCR